MKSKASTNTLAPGAALHYETWLGHMDRISLPLTPENYQIEQVGNDRWSVTDLTGTQIYLGIGPVELAAA